MGEVPTEGQDLPILFQLPNTSTVAGHRAIAHRSAIGGTVLIHPPRCRPCHGEDLHVATTRKNLPVLDTLFLSASCSNDETLTIPVQMFATYTRALRHLKLSYCTVDWTSLVSERGSDVGLRNLLTLHFASLEPPPPSGIFNSILSSSPQVQQLYIDDALPEDFAAAFKWTNPSLQDCHLQGELASTLSLLRHILSMELPSESDVRLTCMVTHAGHMLDSADSSQLVIEAIQCFTQPINKPAFLRGKALELDDDEYVAGAILCDKGESVHSRIEVPQKTMTLPLVKQLCVSEAKVIYPSTCASRTHRRIGSTSSGGIQN